MAAVLAEMSIACRGGCCGPDCEHDAGRGKHLDMMAIPLVKGILGKAYAHLADLATRMHAMAELRLGIEADDPYVFLHSGLGLADAVEVVKTAFLAGAVTHLIHPGL